MQLLTELLRAPAEVAARCRRDDNLRALVLVALLVLAVGAAVFGGVLGSYRGGLQILYSAIKLPVAWLATLALCVPAFYAVTVAFGRPSPVRELVALVLGATARAALTLLAFAPVLWLWIDLGASYRESAMAAVVAYAVAGFAGLGVLLRGLGARGQGLATAGAFVVLFGLAGGQTAWSLRPYLGRPSQEHVPFVRAPEGGFAGAVITSGDSLRRGVR